MTAAAAARVAEIQTRRKAISPAPWKRSSGGCGRFIVDELLRVVADMFPSDWRREGNGKADAEFIAHAPADIDFLLDLLPPDGLVEQLVEVLRARGSHLVRLRADGALRDHSDCPVCAALATFDSWLAGRPKGSDA